MSEDRLMSTLATDFGLFQNFRLQQFYENIRHTIYVFKL